MRNNRLMQTGLVLLLTAAMITGCGTKEGTKDTMSATVNNSEVTLQSDTSGSGSNALDAASEISGSLNIGSGTIFLTSDDLKAATETVNDSYTLRTVEYKAKELETDYSDATVFNLSGDTAEINGKGASIETDAASGSNILRISKKGSYILSGSFNGQIIIDADAEKDVCLLLNNVSITCSAGPAISCINADKLIISTADGSENTLTMTENAENYAPTDDSLGDFDGVIYSKSSLTLNGSGSLSIVSGWKHGIHVTKTLKIVSGNITIDSADTGIKVKNAVLVKDGNVSITSGGDGIKSTNSEDETKGYIYIEGGNISIASATDGIQAETALEITGGSVNIVSGGGSANAGTKTGMNNPGFGMWGGTKTSSEDKESAKGLKAGTIYICAGTVSIDSSDDAFHSNSDAVISGGYINISSGDDGIHADSSLTINSGYISIEKSYEGLEAAVITINDGAIQLTSSDDGLNAAGGSDDTADTNTSDTSGFGFFGGFGGHGGMMGDVQSGTSIVINGGTLIVNASGDGLDSNDTLTINGGQVLVSGPEDNGNAAVDFGTAGYMNGGTLIAYGSSGMIENFDSSSTQAVITYYFDSTVSAGSEVAVYDSSRSEILSFKTVKSAQCVILSSDKFKNGETYTVAATGHAEGTVTVTGIISSGGSANGGFGGFGGFGGDRGGNNGRGDKGNGDGTNRGDFGGKGQRPEQNGNMTDLPEGIEPPEGMELPDGMEFPGGMGFPGGDGNFPGGDGDFSGGQPGDIAPPTGSEV